MLEINRLLVDGLAMLGDEQMREIADVQVLQDDDEVVHVVLFLSEELDVDKLKKHLFSYYSTQCWSSEEEMDEDEREEAEEELQKLINAIIEARDSQCISMEIKNYK